MSENIRNIGDAGTLERIVAHFFEPGSVEAFNLIVWTPYAELYHFESKSRGLEDTTEKQIRFKGEIDHFYERWGDALKAGDPYYNPHLTLEREDFSFR